MGDAFVCTMCIYTTSLAQRIVAMVARYVCLHSYMVASKGHVLVKCGDHMTAIKTSRRWCAGWWQWKLRGMIAQAEKCTLWAGSGAR